MITAFLRNFCASLAALAVFFVAFPLALMFAAAAFVASLGGDGESSGGVLVLDLSEGVAETSPAKSAMKIRGGFSKGHPRVCSTSAPKSAQPPPTRR